MSETTSLNTELFSAEARGRKHVPFAVFAVILIHIVLFTVLLIAAGCRAKARAKGNLQAPPEIMAQKAPQPLLAAAALSTNAPAPAPAPLTPLGIAPALIQPVIATEPPLEKPVTPPAVRKAVQKSSPPQMQRPTANQPRKAKVYVVKAGDTVEKIAKLHGTSVQALKAENNLKNQLLKPGQQLRVSSQKPKTSTDV
jgi:LysM repeat protein